MKIDKSFCAVSIDKDKCKGCINCMKRCPTEAIRVRDGKAVIDYNRCVSCGECIRICQSKAKYATYDTMEMINDYKYKVALAAPSLLGQFPNISDPSIITNALKNIGFDDVFEVARGADLVSKLTQQRLNQADCPKPLISTACPVCVELILIRFHELTDNLIDVLPPLEISAKLAREEAIKKTGLNSSDIGVFFISPCPAKMASTKTGFYTEDCNVDGVISMSEVCLKLMHVQQNDVIIDQPIKASNLGVAWATSGGEVSNLSVGSFLAADGIENVVAVLKELESGKLKYIDYVELNACPGGCVGGVFNIENPFVSKSKIHTIRKYAMAGKKNTNDSINKISSFYKRNDEWKPINVFKLDEDFQVAFNKLQQVEQLVKELPGIDCGTCGAPSCRAFAEDVANGVVDISLCTRKEKK
ncbi:MAG: [Fe-Fe] hydrogenase large subunit C-terminal domain-containing protein [Clostridia bacterium]